MTTQAVRTAPALAALLLLLLVPLAGCGGDPAPADPGAAPGLTTDPAPPPPPHGGGGPSPPPGEGITLGPDGGYYAPGGRRIPDDVPADRRDRLAVNPTRGVTISAVSEDGLNWTREPGVRLALDHELSDKMATAPAALALPDGRWRLYHGGVDLTLGDARVLTAVSDDGLAFEREPGIRLKNGSGFATDPAVIQDGERLVMFFVSCGDEFRNRFGEGFIQRAVSDDGLTFDEPQDVLRSPTVSYESPEVFRAGDRWLMVTNGLMLFESPDLLGSWTRVQNAHLPRGGGTSVVATDDGYRLYFTGHVGERHHILSAHSRDGVNWVEEPGVRLQVDDGSFGVLNPDVHRLADGSWRMYLNYMWAADRIDGP